MPTCIEITTASIRIAHMVDGQLLALQQIQRPETSDLPTCLRQAAIPRDLGEVALLLDGPGLAIRSLRLPPLSASGIDKALGLEVRTLLGEQAETHLASWHDTGLMQGSERELLVLTVRRDLLKNVDAALRSHGARLAHLATPAIGLALHAPERAHLAVALERSQCQLTWCCNGRVLMARSATPGVDQLIDGIAQLRGIDREAAADLVTALTDGAPEDLRDHIQQWASQIASVIRQHLHHIDERHPEPEQQPQCIRIASAVGAPPGLLATLNQELPIPVIPDNPFVGLQAPARLLDDAAELPGPWSKALAAARRKTAWPLDACVPWRQERRRRLLGPQLLRLVAVLCLSISVLALGNLLRIDRYQSRQAHLLDAENGLLAGVGQLEQVLRESHSQQTDMQQRLQVLARHQLPGQISRELLALISSIQDPERCPVRIDALRVLDVNNDALQVELSGTVPTDRPQGAGGLLAHFETELRERYPALRRLDPIPVSALSQEGHAFAYRLHIQDTRAP